LDDVLDLVLARALAALLLDVRLARVPSRVSRALGRVAP
jgi:hypothetical protein